MAKKFFDFWPSLLSKPSTNELVSICILTQDTVTAVIIKQPEGTIQQTLTKTFTTDTFKPTITEIAKEIGFTQVRVLLPEDSMYVLLSQIPTSVGIADQLTQEIISLIPEKIQDLLYDYQIIFQNKEEIQLQLLATHRENIVSLKESFDAANVTIQTIEPPSLALARLTSGEDHPHLIIYGEKPTVATVVFRGVVIEAITIKPRQSLAKHVQHLLSFVKREYGVSPQKIIFSTDREGMAELAKATKLEIIQSKLDAAFGLAQKDVLLPNDQTIGLTPAHVGEARPKKISSKSGQVTAVHHPPLTPRGKNSQAQKPAARKPTNSMGLLWLIICALVLGVGGRVGYYYFVENPQTPSPTVTPTAYVTQEPTKAPTATPKPTATPTPVLNRSDIVIRILNGNGQAGAAGRASEFLEGKGYVIQSSGNANFYNYTTTEVRVKASKAAYKSMILGDLKERYTITEKDSLGDSSTYDVEIILGAQ